MEIIDINGNKREYIRAELDGKWPGFVRVDFESKNRAGYQHSEWYPVAEFLKNNPKLASSIKNAPPSPNDDLGVVSSSKKQSLTDKNKKWTKDAYAGFPVWISRGKGEGQTRTIIANTANTVTVNSPWDVIPNKTSQYVISFNINAPKVFGNSLK